MNARHVLPVVISILFLGSGPAAAADKPGCADHPLFPTRMPGYTQSYGRPSLISPFFTASVSMIILVLKEGKPWKEN